MRIDEYSFHKDFQSLLRWCEPGIKYTVNVSGLKSINKALLGTGFALLSSYLVERFFWFVVNQDVISSETVKLETFKIGCVRHLSHLWSTSYTVRSIYASHILHISNLRKL